jgi:hypothetical protein
MRIKGAAGPSLSSALLCRCRFAVYNTAETIKRYEKETQQRRLGAGVKKMGS